MQDCFGAPRPPEGVNGAGMERSPGVLPCL